ncbi:broad specificity phosphatase PhoE [Lewinella marina]|uniref:SixA phosphatase family protein n=1 Tax=Neolewinella marina TaxID=438751 RepID=UPI001430FF5B|nr:phosphoglycerate mutase family protein [Neolewinella marina]NJB85225.1 broad specificity phosphatase PhoE [Neolewinella marina]
MLLLLTGCDPARREAKANFGEQGVTTFILVRHAEKDYGTDPLLTPTGDSRAARLAEMLSQTELAAVYSTDTHRTRLTAAPAAEQAGLDTQIYDGQALTYFAHQLRRRHAGETVLVVGHSDTTPELANLLAKTETMARFSELDYGNLLVVSIPPVGKAGVLNLRY